MSSLYDELGVEPSADQDELRRAYRQRARELHPDVNDSRDDDSAMQRLNAAWAVLGDPGARWRYDQQARSTIGPRVGDRGPAPGAAPGGTQYREPSVGPFGGPLGGPTGGSSPGGVPAVADPLSEATGCLRMVRPSFIILAVLFAIFVVTAYAGHPGSSTTPEPTTSATAGDSAPRGSATTTETIPAVAFVGRCIREQSASVVLVPCSELPNSLVIATVPVGGLCPGGTSPFLVAGQTEMVCAQPNGP